MRLNERKETGFQNKDFNCTQRRCEDHIFCAVPYQILFYEKKNSPTDTVKRQKAELPILSFAIHLTMVAWSAEKDVPDSGKHVAGDIGSKFFAFGSFQDIGLTIPDISGGQMRAPVVI